jgi:hypothetical protein
MWLMRSAFTAAERPIGIYVFRRRFGYSEQKTLHSVTPETPTKDIGSSIDVPMARFKLQEDKRLSKIWTKRRH